ncbi:hypothetical protein PENTCL1PPCAC_13291 [Pristionchus entomophagus]|uniref:F-box domain-containing protein n=1 Tax=Pristionchus entomophagus TaxID=358040 RepID=A0AAV5T7P8_9BILA|nr:hypothetical protein PENTCL1PPCAC_13291 [Pristionchus entomophagus]
MSILSLPDVFLNDLMRRMAIQDRLNLRLTCRAFERTVADTHAGYFEEGEIYVHHHKDRNGLRGSAYGKSPVKIRIGDLDIKIPNHELYDFLGFRTRLFSGISFGRFKIHVDQESTVEFVRLFLTNFKIEVLDFSVISDIVLENSLKIMAAVPHFPYTMSIHPLIDAEMLQFLPPMEVLHFLVE